MTDQTPNPIQVSRPTQVQLEAGLRQLGLVAVSLFTAVGATVWAQKAGWIVTLAPQLAELATILGPVILATVAWIGQQATREHAKKAVALANKLPNEEAVVK